MEAILNNLVKAIGWSILHSLWQGAIIYAVLFILLMAWPKMSARLKHNLAFGSLFLIFASFCFTFFSIFELPVAAGATIKSIELNQIAYQNLAQFGDSFNLKTEAYFPVVVSVYAVGIAFQLIILSSGYFKLKKLKQASTLSIPETWNTIFEATLAQLKINKTVKFYLSTKVNVPLVIGFFKPVVLFPFALATQLDLKQVEAILIHELSHVRRNDYLINLVKTCIETLLFFNPFVWLTTKFIHIEREHACDDLVVNFTGTPLTYAHALLKLELLKDKQTPALSMAATGTNQHLYQRIKRITDMKTNYMNAKQQFFILTLTIATVVSLAWINPNKKAAKQAKKIESSIVSVKITPVEAKTLKGHLVMKSDTDSTKKKTVRITVRSNDGKDITYTSYEDMPDSVRKRIEAIEKKFSSPEWKEKMAKIELNAKEIEKKFNSPEWKDKMAKIELNAQEIEKKFNSPEWKDKMAKVELNAKELEKKFNSPEWKDKMAKIELNAKEIEKKFNSPEWKNKMADIEKRGAELEKKFNSPEWKEKVEEMRKLQESPEYKELRKKYENEVEELKKKKGIKSDKAFLLFDSNTTVGKTFLPLTNNTASPTFAALPSMVYKPTILKFEGSPSITAPAMITLPTKATAPIKIELKKVDGIPTNIIVN